MKTMSDKGILARIKQIRIEKGYSQEYVGSKLELGQSGYALIENGRNELSVKRLLQIAMILEESLIDLIGYPFKYIKQDDIKDIIEKSKAEVLTLEKLATQYQKNQEKDEQLIESQKQQIKILSDQLEICKSQKNTSSTNA